MKKYGKRKIEQEQGYTLLEYCAGAAIIIGVVWGALVTLGGNMAGLINNIASWAQNRAEDVSSGDVALGSGSTGAGSDAGTGSDK